jgi:hypothetical protein
VIINIIIVGNFLNGENRLAYAIKISSLNKLSELRTTSIGSKHVENMLQYLVHFLASSNVKLLGFYEELSSIHAAARVDPNKLNQELAALTQGLKRMETFKNSNTPRHIHGDTFIRVVGEFLNDATYAMDELRSRHQVMEQILTHLAKYFGEDSLLDGNYAAFFKDTSSFVNKFTNCAKAITMQKVHQGAKRNSTTEKHLVRLKQKYKNK